MLRFRVRRPAGGARSVRSAVAVSAAAEPAPNSFTVLPIRDVLERALMPAQALLFLRRVF